MTLTSRTRINPDVVCTELDGEAVLLELQSKRYYGLNETGTRIWQVLSSGGSIKDAATALVEEYEVGIEEARESVIELCEELLRENLIAIETTNAK